MICEQQILLSPFQALGMQVVQLALQGVIFSLFITSYESSFAHILLKVQISKAIEKWVLFSHVTMTNNIIFAE